MIDLYHLWNNALDSAPANYPINLEFIYRYRDDIIRLLSEMDSPAETYFPGNGL